MSQLSIKMGLFSACLLLTVPAYAIPEKDTGNLGEIRQSILDPDDFQRIYGDGWVLMDGRDVQDTDIFRENLWHEDKIPDARGVFLRSKNHLRLNDTGNPAGDKEVGFYQEDELKSHSHVLKGSLFINNICTGPGVGHHGTGFSPATLEATGGKETRPRNITVNTYIKVNRTVENQHTDSILNTIRELPARVVGNENLTQLIRRIVRQELGN